jgi:hypothetical protein
MRTIRFLKPTKLGVSSASWLVKHDAFDFEWIAKRWLYFLGTNLLLPLAAAFSIGALSVFLIKPCTGASSLVAISVSVKVFARESFQDR